MNITKAAGSVVLGLASMLGSYGCTSQRAFAEDPPVAKEPTKNLETITDEQITALMKYETVDEILKEDKIILAKFEYVAYDATTKTNNYDKLVFQEDVKKEDRKPVLVFFYKNKDPAEATVKGTAHREAIVFKRLAVQYGDKINFVCYNVENNPCLKSELIQELKKQFSITGLPSIAMYGSDDLTKKETEGGIKRLDTYGGGPVDSSSITGSENQIKTWIAYNIEKKYPEKDYVGRFNDCGTISKVNKP